MDQNLISVLIGGGLTILGGVLGSYLLVASRKCERRRQFWAILALIYTDLKSAETYFQGSGRDFFDADGFEMLKMKGLLDLIKDSELLNALRHVYINIANKKRAIERYEELLHRAKDSEEEERNLDQYITRINGSTLERVKYCLPQIESLIKEYSTQQFPWQRISGELKENK